MVTPLQNSIIEFVRSIGIGIVFGDVRDGFVPGLRIDGGTIVIDLARWSFAGDLLHEAGHLALQDPLKRGMPESEGGEEMGAIAWSYAAALHLGINPAVVFHADGYKGWSPELLENFLAGRYIGAPILEWRGLAARGEYPTLRRWTREAADTPSEQE